MLRKSVGRSAMYLGFALVLVTGLIVTGWLTSSKSSDENVVGMDVSASDSSMRYRAVQTDVGFNVVAPVELDGLTLMPNQPTITGPSASPIVVATYVDAEVRPARILTVSQSIGDFGKMGFYGKSPDDTLVADKAAQYAQSTNDQGDLLTQIYWNDDGVYYWVTATNVTFESVIRVAESLETVSS